MKCSKCYKEINENEHQVVGGRNYYCESCGKIQADSEREHQKSIREKRKSFYVLASIVFVLMIIVLLFSFFVLWFYWNYDRKEKE